MARLLCRRKDILAFQRMGSSGPVFLFAILCVVWYGMACLEYYTPLISFHLRECFSAAATCFGLSLPGFKHGLPFRPERKLAGSTVHLKFHFVRLVARSQAEVAGEVAAEELFFLDRGEERLVDCLLVLCAGRGGLLLL